MSSNSDDVFYVKAVGSEPSGTISLKLWENVLNSSQFIEVASDTVLFSVQNGGYALGWIVPSGWTINSDGSLVTPTPHAGASGPQTEGSGIETNDGDVISRGTYENGFNMSFDFSFERNTSSEDCPEGYLYPDTSKDEDTTYPEDMKKIGFFGNSGIKIFGIYEIQIFDTEALCNMLNVNSAEDIEENQLITIDTEGLSYDDGEYRYIPEQISGLISGIGYKASSKSPEDLILAKNRQLDTNRMVINLSKQSIGNDYKYILNVTLNGVTTISNAEITNGTGGKSKKSISDLDISKVIQIQSHWGSGVRLSNFRVEVYI